MKKIRVRKKNLFLLLLIIFIIAFELINPIKIINKNKIMELGYNELSSEQILKLGLKDDILTNNYNIFIDKNIGDEKFNIDYLSNYFSISYDSIIDLNLVNELIHKGYTDKEINAILKTGDEESISIFLEKDKYENILNFLQYDFAFLKNLDKYFEYQKIHVCGFEDTVIYVNLGLEREYYTDYDTVKEFSYTMLVNKYNMLPSDYVPLELTSFPKEYCNGEVYEDNKTVVEAFINMANDLYEQEKLNIYVNSGYRSYQKQEDIFNRYLKAYGKEYTLKSAAKPGFSEHQTGLCIDIKAGSSNTFKNSKESKWLKKNAYKYGFILRYEAGKENITGYKNEEWHYRYVGVDIAKYIKNNNMTYEEYYVKFLNKK